MESINSTQPEIRQAAAYGCGVMGQCGGPGYAQVRYNVVMGQCEGPGYAQVRYKIFMLTLVLIIHRIREKGITTLSILNFSNETCFEMLKSSEHEKLWGYSS
jgi:hypothetical protein